MHFCNTLSSIAKMLYDKINTKVSKTILDLIAELLTDIFNLFIEKYKWPEALNKVRIFKSDDKFKAWNYRSILFI